MEAKKNEMGQGRKKAQLLLLISDFYLQKTKQLNNALENRKSRQLEPILGGNYKVGSLPFLPSPSPPTEVPSLTPSTCAS